MNYLEKIPEIIEKIKDSGDQLSAQKVSDAFYCSSTEGVTHTLLAIVHDDEDMYALIGEDVMELRAFCLSIGLKVR